MREEEKGGGRQLLYPVCFSKKELTPRKEFAPWGANSFLIYTPFQNGDKIVLKVLLPLKGISLPYEYIK